MAGIGVFVLGGPRSIFDLFAYLPFVGGGVSLRLASVRCSESAGSACGF